LGSTRRSFSQLKEYSDCSEAYRLKRIVKAPQRPAAWFTHGRAFHSAIEHYELSGREATEDQCIAAFEAAWQQGIIEDYEKQSDLSMWMTGGRRKPETDIETRFAEGKQQVLDYMTYIAESGETVWTTPDGKKAVELEIEFELSGVRVIVFIDQVMVSANGARFVRDLKTGSSYNSPIQLAVYDLALEARYGERTGWGDFYRAKKAKPDPLIDLRPYTAERVGAWFHQMDAAQNAGIYLPNPSDKCRNLCGVSQWCTAVGGAEFSAVSQHLT
jgi:putative RecB family exonuclease